MKKFAAIALALVIAMSTMLSTVAVATDGGSVGAPEALHFAGFDIIKDVVVDTEKMIVYGFEGWNAESKLSDYLVAGDGFEMDDITGPIGTGSELTLKRDGKVVGTFKVVLFGDLNGDGFFDVLDASMSEKIVNGHAEADDCVALAGDTNGDGDFGEDDYAAQVNGVLAEDFEQNAGTNGATVEDGEIQDQVYTGFEIMPNEEFEIKFNDVLLDFGDDFTVEYINNIDEGTATAIITGTGLYAGTQTITFNIVSLIQDIALKLAELTKEAGLEKLVTVNYDTALKDFVVSVDASELLAGDLALNMQALEGLLTEIDAYRAKNLKGIDLKIGDYAVANDGAFSRSAVKALVLDFASGIFADLANCDSNTLRAYQSTLVEQVNGGDVTTDFTVQLKVVGDPADIAELKEISAKVSRYIGMNVVNGNVVVDITMPAAFSTAVVDILGDGDVEKAAEKFNSYSVGQAFEYLSYVTAEDISVSSAEHIKKFLGIAVGLDGLVDKVLGEVSAATVTDANGNTTPLLNNASFNIIENTDNDFGAIVNAVAGVLNKEFTDSYVGAFANDGIYTAEFDVTLDYKNISEKIVVNLDLFGAAEAPSVIEETVKYFDSVITDLKIDNAAAVKYDEENLRVLATLNATELLAGRVVFNEAALDGLYSETKEFFNCNYGTSTITVGDYEIVTNGDINKSELKGFIFNFVNGFFSDAANIGADNVVRTYSTIVKTADGKEYAFDIDFALDGDNADIAALKSLSAKISRYISLDTTTGNAEVTVGLPAGLREALIDVLGNGEGVEKAMEKFNAYSVDEAFENLSILTPEDFSASSAAEIEKAISMVCGMEGLANKLLGKVSDATATTVTGKTYTALSGAAFNIATDDFAGLVLAVKDQLSTDLRGLDVAEFANGDGSYTVKFDVALSVGGIKETVIFNLDVFGDVETEDAINETVNYVDSIISELGINEFAAVAYDAESGKAVASLDADAFVTKDLTFNDEALDGLYTEAKDYFKANYGDSTIKVGAYELVTEGNINKSELKALIFDFAKGFFSDVANMDASNVARTFDTVVTYADGEEVAFELDFALAGSAANVEKIKNLSEKISSHVSLDTTSGNAEVTVTLPAGLKEGLIDVLGNGEGVEKAMEKFNAYSVDEAFENLSFLTPEDFSADSAAEIEKAISMVCSMEVLANKLLGKVSNATATTVTGKTYTALSGAAFNIATDDFAGLVLAVKDQLSTDLRGLDVAEFANGDGSYTVEFDVALSVGGISEKVAITLDIFGGAK